MGKKSLWQIKESQSHSWNWKAILRLRPLARRFVNCRVGNGKTLFFWHDCWTPFGPLLDYIGSGGPRDLRIPLDATVGDACSATGWRIPSPRSEREVDLHAFLSTINLPLSQQTEDTFSWLANGVITSKFSSKRTWEDLRYRNAEQPWTEVVWFRGAIPAHAFHCWVSHWNRLPTLSRIRSWKGNQNISVQCSLCSGQDESRDHLFFTCSFASEIWHRVYQRLNQTHLQINDWNRMILWLASIRSKERATLARLASQATVYHIWKNRNYQVHNGVKWNPNVVFRMIDKDIRNAISGRRSRKRWRRLMGMWFSYVP